MKTVLVFVCLMCCNVARGDLVLIGDSTVADLSLAQPRRGWGQMLPDVNTKPVHNFAVNGASSKSFRNEFWDDVSVYSGDMLLMQFGHNDQKINDPDRYTTLEEFKANLQFFIDEANSIGAIPVVVTPIERWQFNSEGNVIQSLADRAIAAREVAMDNGLQFVDLHWYSVERYNFLGEQGTIDFYGAVDGDRTHPGAQGATDFAQHLSIQIPEPSIFHPLLLLFFCRKSRQRNRRSP